MSGPPEPLASPPTPAGLPVNPRQPDGGSGHDGPNRSRRRLVGIGAGAAVAVVAVVVVLWLAGVGPFAGAGAAPQVTIQRTTLSFSPTSNPCFPSDYGTQTAGTLATGGTYILLVNLTSQAHGTARFCTVVGINVTTPGFVLASANVPLLVPAAGQATLRVVVTVPSAAYLGDLNLTAAATYVLPNVTVRNQNLYYTPQDPGECGLGDAFTAPFATFPGFTVNDSVAFIAVDPSASCTISAVQTNTTGFYIVSSNTPYAIPANTLGGVSFVLGVPRAAFEGNVSIILDLTV